MPVVEVGGLRVRYALGGPPDAPLVVLSASLGTSLALWDPQVPALEARFRVLRYDTRGHGGTSAPPGPYTIAELAGDVAGLMDALGLERGHFCGLSLGGQIGMWLGAHAPRRIDRLVLCNTSPRIGKAETWNARIEAVRRDGMRGVSDVSLDRWFSPAFRAASPDAVAAARRILEATPPAGYAAACAALRDADLRADVAAIRAPTLVIAGRQDPATPAADGRLLADAIPGAEYVELDTAHLSNLEAPERFTSALVGFLGA
jgi:3-oxoadipate enol-lactonase